MVYLKVLLCNFLIIFFVNHLIPGIDALARKLPEIGDDLIFALALGFLNSLIYPIFKLFKQAPTGMRIALISLVLNFAAYAIIKLSPVGIQVNTIQAYCIASIIASIGSFVTNFYESRLFRVKKMEPPPEL